MNSELEPVIRRIQKLLALGTSPNEHEATAAVAKAQELLEQYDLTMETVGNLKSDKRTSIATGEVNVKVTQGKPEGWKEELFEAVAQTSDCFTAWKYRYETTPSGKDRHVKEGAFIGFKHDVEVSGYSFSFLVGEIERLAQLYANTLWSEIKTFRDARGISQHEAESLYTQRTGRHPLKAKLYFIKGAVTAVIRNLHRGYGDRMSASGNPHAIVLHRDKRAAVKDHVYFERYGQTYTDMMKEREAANAVIYRNTESTPVRPETAAERRKRERQEARWRQQEARREAKREAATDYTALEAGRSAGRNVSLRKGINNGQERPSLK